MLKGEIYNELLNLFENNYNLKTWLFRIIAEENLTYILCSMLFCDFNKHSSVFVC